VLVVVVADFGMDAEDEDEEAAKEEDTDVYGTFEYMSPECYKRDYGVPCFASDVLSFGVILWELWARERVYMGFNGIEDIPDASGKADVSLVPQRMAVLGQRPQVREEWSCGPAPEPWSKLCSACWQKEVTTRPTFPQIKEVLQRMKDMDGAGWSYVPAPEPELSYLEWLTSLGMEGKIEAFAEWDVGEGKDMEPRERLVEMLVEEEEQEGEDLQDMIADVFEGDDAAQKAFRSAVELLRSSIADPEPEPAAEGSATGNASWRELCDLLGVRDGDIVKAGKTEDPRLLRLRAVSLDKESRETVEQIVEESKQKDATISEQAAHLASAQREIERLREELARSREA
jgi:hypothetical protein